MKTEVKDSPLNMRITKHMRQRLQDAAAANGRSVSQEVDIRVNRSFLADPGLGGERQEFIIEDMAAVMNGASMALSGAWHENHMGWLLVQRAWLHLLHLVEPKPPRDFEGEISPAGRSELNRWRKETEPKRQAQLNYQRELAQLRLKKSAFILDRSEEMRLEILEMLPEPEPIPMPALDERDLQLWHSAEEQRILSERAWNFIEPVLRQASARINRQRGEWED